MKGIILAGGSGKRLYPLTRVISKQMVPIAGLQMIFYPLNTLLSAGINEIAIVVSSVHAGEFMSLLDPMLRFIDVDISWQVQEKPLGIPEAFTICRGFIGEDNVTLILGDNIFGENPIITKTINNFCGGGHIFAKKSSYPDRFGVVVLDSDEKNIRAIVEKPVEWVSDFIIPGLYMFDSDVIQITQNLKPSERGELEITEVHNAYLANNALNVTKLADDGVWMDAGTHKSYAEATGIVQEKELLRVFHSPLVQAINQFAPYKEFDFYKTLCY